MSRFKLQASSVPSKLFKVGPGIRLPGLPLGPGQSWETAGRPDGEVFAGSSLGFLLLPPLLAAAAAPSPYPPPAAPAPAPLGLGNIASHGDALIALMIWYELSPF